MSVQKVLLISCFSTSYCMILPCPSKFQKSCPVGSQWQTLDHWWQLISPVTGECSIAGPSSYPPALEQINRPVILRWLDTGRKLFPRFSPQINKHHPWRGSEKHTSLEHQNWVFRAMSWTRTSVPQSQDSILCLFIDETGTGVHSIAKYHGPQAKIP